MFGIKKSKMVIEQKPVISVIIPTYNESAAIRSCLDSLGRQGTEFLFEIIVVDSSRDGTDRIIKQEYPDVRLIHFNDQKFCGEARNIGFRESSGDIIAFIDGDCIAEETWLSNLYALHEKYDIVGGAIGNASDTLTGWASYFTEYSAWMPGTRAGFVVEMAEANISYKKNILLKYGPYVEKNYCSDTILHWQLKRNGYNLRFEPSSCVRHASISRLFPFLIHEFYHGKSFGWARVRYNNFSTFKRIVYTLCAPAVAARIFFKVLLNNIINPVYLGKFVLCVPLVCLGICFWVAGECRSYMNAED